MEEKKWFILINDQVSGPYTPSDITQKEQNPDFIAALFWAKAKSQWLDFNAYKKEIQKDEEQARLHIAAQASRLWKVKDQDEEKEPMTYKSLIEFLKTKKDLSTIRIWTQGYADWTDVFQNHKILEELGVSRRQHPRVPIQGQVSIELAGNRFLGDLAMISEGGFGIKKGFQLSIGDKIKGGISAPALPSKINCTAEVVYVGQDGFVGLKYINISTEAKSSIVEYVKKFLQTQGDQFPIAR